MSIIVCKDCGVFYSDSIWSESQRAQMYGDVDNCLCPNTDCRGQLVELDQEIYPIIKNIWDKGYQTSFSCEGHYDVNRSQLKSCPYLVFSHNVDIQDEEIKTFVNKDILITSNFVLKKCDSNKSHIWLKNQLYDLGLISLIKHSKSQILISIKFTQNYKEDGEIYPDFFDFKIILYFYPKEYELRYYENADGLLPVGCYDVNKPSCFSFYEYNKFKRPVLNELYAWSESLPNLV